MQLMLCFFSIGKATVNDEKIKDKDFTNLGIPVVCHQLLVLIIINELLFFSEQLFPFCSFWWQLFLLVLYLWLRFLLLAILHVGQCFQFPSISSCCRE